MTNLEYASSENDIVESSSLRDNNDGTITVTFQETELATEFISKNGKK